MKVKITVPTSLSEIKLSQYQKFLRTTKDSEDINFINKQIVGIFCDLPDDVVNSMTQKSFDEICADITNLLKTVNNQKLQRIVNYNDKKYGFIPNLDDITVGEQADISLFIKDWQEMNKAMSVLYRPVLIKRKEAYIIEEYMGDIIDLKEKIKKHKNNKSKVIQLKLELAELELKHKKHQDNFDLPLDVALGAYFFFVNLAKDLLNYIPNYIEKVAQQDENFQNSEVNGVGITQSMASLREICSSLTMSLN